MAKGKKMPIEHLAKHPDSPVPSLGSLGSLGASLVVAPGLLTTDSALHAVLAAALPNELPKQVAVPPPLRVDLAPFRNPNLQASHLAVVCPLGRPMGWLYCAPLRAESVLADFDMRGLNPPQACG